MRYLLLLFVYFLSMASTLFGEEKIDIFPASPYDQSGIYLDLILFWMALLGLVMILLLKLRETERVQKMDKECKQEETPLLD